MNLARISGVVFAFAVASVISGAPDDSFAGSAAQAQLRPSESLAVAGELMARAFRAAQASCAAVGLPNVGECALSEEEIREEEDAAKAARVAMVLREDFVLACRQRHPIAKCSALLKKALDPRPRGDNVV